MSDNLKIWNAVKQPPPDALKEIKGGRLSGKTDISPQWRYQVMTEQFGICGVGWKYIIARTWTEAAPEGQVMAFAEIHLFVRDGEEWSDAIPSTGGSFLVEKETKGLHANDEGYKMAITDALGTAMKMLGVAADVYRGKWDGAKYRGETSTPPEVTTLAVLLDKIAEAKAFPHLQNIWTKYDKEIKGLSPEDLHRLVLAKDNKKVELGGAGK